MNKFEDFFEFNSIDNCDLHTKFYLTDDHGKELDISSNNRRTTMIKGSITSKECEIDFDFEVSPQQYEYNSVLLFLLLNILATIFNVVPIYNALRTMNLHKF